MKDFLRSTEHLVRVAILLVVGIAAFLLIRRAVIPPEFGKFGHFPPSAFLLHGYVGFIFSSIKANPRGASPLMPVVFIFSAMVSGIVAVVLLYMLTSKLRKVRIDMRCVDIIGRYLLYAFVIDFSLEMRDLVHTRLYFSQVILQIGLGTLVPIGLLGLTQVVKFSEGVRKAIYAVCGSLTLVSIFAMRWNIVIGGQLFSKSFLGYTSYKMAFATREGLLPALALIVLPFVLLYVLVKLLPPWPKSEAAA